MIGNQLKRIADELIFIIFDRKNIFKPKLMSIKPISTHPEALAHC
jgi:hypothetical protein